MLDPKAFALFAELIRTDGVATVKSKMRQQILQDIENSETPEEAFRYVQNLKYLSQFLTHLEMEFAETKTQKERDHDAQSFESPVR